MHESCPMLSCVVIVTVIQTTVYSSLPFQHGGTCQVRAQLVLSQEELTWMVLIHWSGIYWSGNVMKVFDDRPSVVDLYYSLQNLPNLKVRLGEALLYAPGYLCLLPLLSFITCNVEWRFTASDQKLGVAWERGKVKRTPLTFCMRWAHLCARWRHTIERGK